MSRLVLIAFSLAALSSARAADLKDLEFNEALGRNGLTDSVLDQQPRMVLLAVAECSAKHLLCEGTSCASQLDACVSMAARQTSDEPARAISSLERPRLKSPPRTSR